MFVSVFISLPVVFSTILVNKEEYKVGLGH